ncbi:MAG: hypothetical protein QM775_16545 [Pirellulales bacterium]
MGLLKFTVENWHELDEGRMARAVEQAIRRIVNDCKDRPGLDSARKLGLTLVFTPFTDDLNDIVEIKMDYDVKTSVPSTGRGGMSLGVQKNGELLFSSTSPHNVNQSTMFGDDDASEGGEGHG